MRKTRRLSRNGSRCLADDGGVAVAVAVATGSLAAPVEGTVVCVHVCVSVHVHVCVSEYISVSVSSVWMKVPVTVGSISDASSRLWLWLVGCGSVASSPSPWPSPMRMLPFAAAVKANVVPATSRNMQIPSPGLPKTTRIAMARKNTTVQKVVKATVRFGHEPIRSSVDSAMVGCSLNRMYEGMSE